jgi:hypothetical protein
VQQVKSYNDVPSMTADPANESVIDRKGQFKNHVDIDAEIVPFPAHRRHWFINRAFVASSECKDSDKYLRAIVARHRDRLEHLGVAPARIVADVAALEEVFFGYDHGDVTIIDASMMLA